MASAQNIRAGRAFVELGVKDRTVAGLRRAQQRLKAFGSSLRSLGLRLTALGAGVAAPLLASVKVFAKAGDQLDKMSRRTGFSAEALSELGFAAEQSGTDLGTLEKGVRTLQRSINDAERGLSTAVDALEDLGLTVKDLRGLSPEQQFKLVAERLSRIEDPSKRAAVAMMLLGRAGTQLLPLMQAGARGIEELQQQARALGLTVSTEAAGNAALLTDTINILWRTVKQAAFAIGAALAPTLIDLAKRGTRVVIIVTDWLKQNRELVVTVLKVAAGIAAAGVAFITAGVLVSGLGMALGGLASILSAVHGAIGALAAAFGTLVSPIGLVVGAVAGLGTAVAVYTGVAGEALDWLKEQFGRLRGFVGKVVAGISDALAAGDLGLAANVLWLGLKVAWQTGVNALNAIWQEARKTFVQTAYDMWYGSLTVAETVWHRLKVAWIETTAFLSKGWEQFTSFLSETWHTIANVLAKTWNWLRGLFDDTFDVAAANLEADLKLVEQLQGREAERQKLLDEIERRRQERRTTESGVHEATLGELAKAWAGSESKVNQAAAEALKETEEELAKAKQAMAEAIVKAREEREAAVTGKGPPTGRRFSLAEYDQRLGAISETLARRAAANVTFSSEAVFGLGGAGNALERTAKATEAMQTTLQSMWNLWRMIGLVSGPSPFSFGNP